jgi:hypothetical protein
VQNRPKIKISIVKKKKEKTHTSGSRHVVSRARAAGILPQLSLLLLPLLLLLLLLLPPPPLLLQPLVLLSLLLLLLVPFRRAD